MMKAEVIHVDNQSHNKKIKAEIKKRLAIYKRAQEYLNKVRKSYKKVIDQLF